MEAQGSLKDFQIIKLLGEGAFGQVYMVKRKQDAKIYAMKKVKITGMKQKQKDNALNQIRILASLTDDYIVRFKEGFYDTQSGHLCIVMEYAGGGDLLKMINTHIRNRTRISEQEIWKALTHIAKGMKSLHDKKILHRDLKSANIFIGSDGSYKLGDLNVSKVLKKGLAYTQTGTPYYASPQVWQDLPYDMKSDMWSFGCVLYEMATLQPPFKAQDLQSLFKKIKAGVYKAIPSYYSNQLSSVIDSLLKLKPKDRPDADTLLKHHIVLKKLGFETKQEDVYGSELLKTIKFNPYNLNGLKGKLPKSSYDTDNKLTARGERDTDNDSKYSRDSLDRQRDRVLSACGVRRDVGLSPQISRKDEKKEEQKKYVPLPIGGKGLPPRPNNPLIGKRGPDQDYNNKDRQARLRRVAQQVLGGNAQRCSSVNK